MSEKPFGRRRPLDADYREVEDPPLNQLGRADLAIVRGKSRLPWTPGGSQTPWRRKPAEVTRLRQ